MPSILDELKTLPHKRSKKGIILSVKVEPKASKKGISGVMGEILKVKVTAAPEGGRANDQLIEILSEAFDVKKSSIRIIKGISSRNKLIEVSD
ncbi:MAG: DUF167 domain-containing protein [Nitrospirae bacterium]|nr:DUF167 domain-containing protein [Nitrospirota bacterium]